VADELRALLARIEEATGADRAIDATLSVLFRIAPPDSQDWVHRWAGEWRAEGGRVWLIHEDGSHGPNFRPRPWTESVDAALALVERLGEDPSQILSDAIEYLGTTGWSGSWLAALPRFIVIALLRAHLEGAPDAQTDQ
jgi:hypothetical protein